MRPLRRWWEWSIPRRLLRAARHTAERQRGMFAAAISFYAVLWMLPFAAVVLSGVRLITGRTGTGESFRRGFERLLAEETSVETADRLMEFLTVASGVDEAAISAGVAGLLVTGATLFVTLQIAFDRVWDLPEDRKETTWHLVRRLLLHRLRAFAVLFGLVLTGTLGFVAILVGRGVFWERIPWFGTYYQAASVVLNWLLLFLLYGFVPRGDVRFRDAARGALLVTLIWELGRWPLDRLAIAAKLSTYGLLGLVLAIMLWVFYASNAVLLGASYVRLRTQDARKRAARKGSRKGSAEAA